MDKDLISVIVPVYKVEEYLNRCVDSIINQTYKNLEIILVDDGSPDNCGKICDDYAKHDKRIKVIHKKNGGLSDARNAGLDIAKGKYIGFVDSDDYISENMYEILHKELVKNRADISICDYYTFDKKYPIFKLNDYEIKEYYNLNALDYVNITGLIPGDTTWNKLYKRKLFKSIRFPLNRVYEDVGTTYKIYNIAKKIITVDIKLYAYFYRKNSISHNISLKTLLDMIEMSNNKDDFLYNFKDFKKSALHNKIDCYTTVLLYVSLLKDYSLLKRKEFLDIYNYLKSIKLSDVDKKYLGYKYYIFLSLRINKYLTIRLWHIFYLIKHKLIRK